ncbi:right-handed parallel beta-helix repeat-containing protein [bacterium]|nr:right-handed parallel beta-helix repeat-containing protein [bacterium]
MRQNYLYIKMFLLLAALLSLTLQVAAADYYVDAVDGSDSSTGASADEAWRTITNALDQVSGASIETVTIHVLDGIYSASTNGESFPLVMRSNVSLVGQGASATTIDANRAACHVISCRDLEDIRIEGATVRGGKADGVGSDSKGGGILFLRCSDVFIGSCSIIENMAWTGGGVCFVESSGSIEDCAFVDNSGTLDLSETSWGGGIGLYDSSPAITDCELTGNSAWAGGGISCQLASPTIEDCIVSDNFGRPDANERSWGGGICCDESAPIIAGCLVSGNSAWAGAGIHCQVLAPTIENCTISSNVATADWIGTSYGGGISSEGASVVVRGCTISGNEAISGAGIRSWWDSTPLIADCDISANTAPLDEDGDSWGGGIHFYQVSPSVLSCTLNGNEANSGAGVYCDLTAGVFDSLIISQNTATPDDSSASWGGGINCRASTVLIVNSTVSENSANSGAGIRLRGEPSSTVIGCEITNNEGEPDSDGVSWGGGIDCYEASPSFVDCEIEGNSATQGGGVRCSNDSAPVFTNCEISGNTATQDNDGDSWGGGVHTFRSSPEFIGCKILENSATKGAGVRCAYGEPIFRDSTIGQNAAVLDDAGISEGGGFSSSDCLAIITNCMILENSALIGGAIFSSESALVITNCTMADNEATTGGAIRANETPTPTIDNSILWGNGDGVSLGPTSAIDISFSCVGTALLAPATSRTTHTSSRAPSAITTCRATQQVSSPIARALTPGPTAPRSSASTIRRPGPITSRTPAWWTSATTIHCRRTRRLSNATSTRLNMLQVIDSRGGWRLVTRRRI